MYNRKWGSVPACKVIAPNLVYRQCEKLGAFNPHLTVILCRYV